ncbi:MULTISPECIES: restriction endonuclease subunit S [unclassified Microcoleus]|uniref:restriction endonuclease subunit S n=1 Tax=unclassified Microcoleus TaxID=2642155 RepID=UPI002FD4E4BC
MNQEKKCELNPTLRFPEFRDTGDWENISFCDLLEDILDFRGRTPLKLGMKWGGGNIISLSANNVKNGYIDYDAECNLGSQALYEKWMGKVSVDKNDIVFTMEAPLGNALLIPDTNKYILSQRVVVFKTKKKVNNFFLIQLIWSAQFQSLINKLATGSTAKGINQKSLKKVFVKIPSPSEQQKIAGCLSSIDDRITAETQKLATLKAHKKGLMQQLFPAEGETLPKLRFPEFEDAGEWVLKKFSKYIVLYRGSSPRPIQSYLTSDSSGVNWIKIGDTKFAKNFIISQVEEKITTKGAKKSRRVNVGELILANSMSYGKTYQVAIDGYIYDGWFVLRDYEEYFDKQFLLQLLNSEYMQNQYKRFSAGGIVQNISSDIVYKTVLPHTSLKEQKKIADCLSSLDELIAAQTQAISTLKTHKKGLMQQLFPSVEDVKG